MNQNSQLARRDGLTGVTVMEVYIYFHPSGNNTLRQRQPILQAVLSLICAGPDPDTRKVSSVVVDNSFKLGTGCRARIFVNQSGLFNVDQRADISTVVPKRPA